MQKVDMIAVDSPTELVPDISPDLHCHGMGISEDEGLGYVLQ